MARNTTNPVAKRTAKTVSTPIWSKSNDEPDKEDTPSEQTVTSVRRTFHLSPDVVLLLIELQLEELRETGEKPPLSALVNEAVRLLGQTRRASTQN
jgi:hypothetical protein